jgi:predicted acylesterase/phospholipase RssA
MSFEHIVTVMIDRDEQDFFIVVDVGIQDDSFSHEFGVEKRQSPYVEEIEVYQDDEKITDEKIIAKVTEYYDENLINDDYQEMAG